MSQKNKQPVEIGLPDIEEFLDTSSDFAFEMQVLHKINTSGFTASHSGTYRDPLTNKSREYDIRAVKQEGNRRLYVSVECKGLSKAAPLLIHTTARTEHEAFHYLLLRSGSMPLPQPQRFGGLRTCYEQGLPVGKKMNQVTRNPNNGVLSGNDKDVFAHVDQALSSAYDLIQTAAHHKKQQFVHAVIPMLVVPDNTLWCVHYTRQGERSQPKQEEAISFYVDQQVSITGTLHLHPFYISHVEIVTETMVEQILGALMTTVFNAAETS